jgi:hypothetical protein
MKKYFVCQTGVYKSYLFLPDDWSGIFRYIFSWIINIVTVFQSTQNDASLIKSIIGPNQMLINIVVTPLKQDEPEPSIEFTSEVGKGTTFQMRFPAHDEPVPPLPLLLWFVM